MTEMSLAPGFDAAALMWPALGGLALGAFFYGGLWWTVRRVGAFRHPAACVLASLLARMGVVVVGIYLVGAGDLVRLGACLLAFLLARVLVTRATGARPGPAPEPGVQHAP